MKVRILFSLHTALQPICTSLWSLGDTSFFHVHETLVMCVCVCIHIYIYIYIYIFYGGVSKTYILFGLNKSFLSRLV